jgi:SAM-dependent methyltransferase
VNDEAGFTTATYGDAFADVYDDWYGAISDLDGTLDNIFELAGGRRVLELGVGTGRVALPLAQRGASVTGIDASAAMLTVLRAKPGAEAVEVLEGDMSELLGVPPQAFAVVFATFNTLFNLPSEAAQRRCLERVVQVLEPGGYFVVEAFLPSDPPPAPEGRLDVRSVEVDRVHLTATWRDPHSQTVRGQHIELSEAGTRLRPWLLRYASPDQLDALAADVGFALSTRHAGWRGEPFDPLGGRHVSIYQHRPRTEETP